jgi:hypothetical protein
VIVGRAESHNALTETASRASAPMEVPEHIYRRRAGLLIKAVGMKC